MIELDVRHTWETCVAELRITKAEPGSTLVVATTDLSRSPPSS
jgi:hypothetical protein